jgi:hypothetical protein
MQFDYSYHFHPVGQGLFSSGFIKRVNGPNNFYFSFVYDCGSSTSQNLINDELDRLSRNTDNRGRINLLTLSHFDNDHISGVVSLLKKFKVGILMLPYMSLAERLIIAFEEGGGEGDPLFDFYINPVRYFLDQGVQGIEHILFVPPSGDKGPPYPGDQTSPPESGLDDELRFVSTELADDAEMSFLESGTDGTAPAVKWLAPGSALTLAKFGWEFIPYNDDPRKVIPHSFVDAVRENRENLRLAGGSPAREEALRKLKEQYDNFFGGGPKKRNLISLFLYSGPIYQRWNRCGITHADATAVIQPILIDWHLKFIWFDRSDDVPPQEEARPRGSILYTGDGYLNTKKKLQNLVNYLDENRVRQVGVFQVMHHGAKANWRQGTAAAIAPLFSVFSSDPEHKGYEHPHATVLRDFWSYGAVQVDKVADFTAYGHLSTP